MKAGDIIYARLAATSAVTTLVSTRIYPEQIPLEADYPAIGYQVELGEPVPGSAPVQPCTVLVHCWAHADASAASLGDAVDGALNTYSGADGNTRLFYLFRQAYDEVYDEELNLWGRLLTYAAMITY